jgi:hypothetical protein
LAGLVAADKNCPLKAKTPVLYWGSLLVAGAGFEPTTSGL